MGRLVIIVICLASAAKLALAAMSSPLSPEQERATFRLADTNLIIELVAAEPEVRAPVALAWDADARMFVAEMTDYPSGPAGGQIRLLEDRDGDGRCERATVFATNLAFPNGVMAWQNGVLVTAAPDIWFLADTNGDGAADVRERVLTGFAEGNQQLRVNGLFWGIDNWIYGANGRSDGEARWGDGTTAGSIRRHDFRFRPDTKRFEAVAGHSQFGMGYDDWGNRFPVFNNMPVRHVVIEDRYLSRQRSLAGTDNVPNISPAKEGNRVFALTPPTLLIPQAVGFFTSACGPSVFRGTALPEAYRGNYFVCEPVQNVVQRRALKPDGSTFIAEYVDAPAEFLASTDRWFHGVFTATGPDGALYIVDFYRDLVEHPHWVAPELRDKIDWRRGEEHGRIWRVRAKNGKLATVQKLSRAPNAELVRALESGNGWTRDTAQRLLVERHAIEAGPALEKLARQGLMPQGRVCALQVLDEFSLLNTRVLLDALADPHPRVREQSVLLSARHSEKAPREPAVSSLLSRLFALCHDTDPRVRLAVASAVAPPAGSNDLFKALACVANSPQLDLWQALAILGNVSGNSWPLLQELKPLLQNGTEPQLHLLERLAALTVADGPGADAGALENWLQRQVSPNRFRLLAAMTDATPLRGRAEIAARWSGSNVVNAASNAQLAEPVRVAAIRLLGFGVQAGDRRQDADGTLLALLAREQPEAVQVAAVKALVEATDSESIRAAFAKWSEASRAVRRQALVSSARSASASLALLDFVENGTIAKPEIDPPTRQALQKSRDTAVAARAKVVLADEMSLDRDAVVRRYRAALKLEADRRRGALVFEKNCAVCHQMQGVGANLGPDLSAVGQHARETLLVDILDPSRQVLPDFAAYTAETKSGDSYQGFIATETSTTVTLRRPNAPDITLERSQLKELRTGGKSLMPDGLEAGMSEQDVADLIEFLRRPDRTLFSDSSGEQ